MTQNKVNCNNCGALILETTAQRNNGLCVPCKLQNDIEVEYKEKQKRKQERKEANAEINRKKGQFAATIFVNSFQFIVLSSGIYFFYKNYFYGKDHGWIALTNLVAFTIMFLLFLYNLIIKFKNKK